MNFIILGDKFQKRMKSRGCVGLITVNNKSIIQHQYDSIKKCFPSSNIIYVYGFENRKFNSFIDKNNIKNNIHSVYNEYYDTYNQGYSLNLVKEFFNKECFILLGDNILNYKIFHNFKNHNSQVFINVKQKNALGCVINHNCINNISYDLDNYISDIYYLSGEHALLLQKLIESPKHYNYFLFELINKLIDGNETIQPFYINQKQLLINGA
jgi:choline kinase